MQKILIADDDARMRRMIREIIAGLGMTVCEAHSGAEAFGVYMIERPDWVLMDLRMKPGDGLQATSQIKAQAPAARVVIVSQHDDPELRKAAAQAGACAYVLKDNLYELPGILTGMSPAITAKQASVSESGTVRPS